MGAVVLHLRGIVGHSVEEEGHCSLGGDVVLQVVTADVYEAGQHEVVSMDKELQEEVKFVLLDHKVVTVDVLNDAFEVHTGHILNADRLMPTVVAD